MLSLAQLDSCKQKSWSSLLEFQYHNNFVVHICKCWSSLFFTSASHPNLQYVADFAPELGMIISETKYLEQLGFQVPELARNVALQVRALKEL